jgi:hypothetical protein
MSYKEKYGRFKITNDLIREGKGLYELFSNFIILRCEHDYGMAEFLYTAKSELFDEITVGEMIPEYMIICHTKMLKNGKKNYKFTAERITGGHA